MLFLPLDERNTCDKAKGLCVTSERYIGGGLGVRCLSRVNSGQDSRQQALVHKCRAKGDASASHPQGSGGWRLRGVTSVGCCFVSEFHGDISLPYRRVSEEERGCL